MAVIQPLIEGLFGSLPGISQLPPDLGFSCFVVHNLPAVTRFVSSGTRLSAL